MASNKPRIPPVEEIEKRYEHAFGNSGFKLARDRALPNSGERTNEEEVLEHIENDDEGEFLDRLKDRIRRTTGFTG